MSPSSSSASSSSSYKSIELSKSSSKFKSHRFHKSLGGNLNKKHDSAQGGTCNKKAKSVSEKGGLIKTNNESLENYFLKFDRSSKTTSVNEDSSKKPENSMEKSSELIKNETKQLVLSDATKNQHASKFFSSDDGVNIKNKKTLSVELHPKTTINPEQLHSKFGMLNFSPKFDLKYYSTHSSFTSDDG